MPRFPAGFRWGVSTAAYQIEGAVDEDGRGRSIWDTFSHQPDRIANGDTGDVACDHYHRYREDVALMADLGVNAYRFSIAWPRIQPDGSGAVNRAGVGFYDRLVDALLERDIDPVATLFHWDLPQALQDAGGWLNRDTSYRFADYAGLVAGALGDRIKLWITLNEPFVHMSLGHAVGMHAPGEMLLFGAFPVAHHQLLGHGLAVAALRQHSASPVTIANNYTPVRVMGDQPEDRDAASAYDAMHNRMFTDPLLGLGYPTGQVDDALIHDGDMETIAAPLDALGVNYYNPTGVRAADPDSPLPFLMAPLEGYETTDFGWPVVPDGLRELLVTLRDRYRTNMPIYITESGCSFGAAIDDQRRAAYLDSHIRAVAEAIDQGVDVRGYFVWSLMDNFEWAEGFKQRFGLVHVDFASQVRTPRTSYGWYRDMIAAQRR